MSALKSKLKELIFECDSEQEAMDLLKSYRKKNFHLVSKKVVDPNSSTVALKLIKFKQPSKSTDLESVWENFVHQMSDNSVEDSFTAEILRRIRTKKRFWEVHPEDHLRDIVMDAKNYCKSENLAKVLVYIAPKEELMSFLCAYQKSIASIIKELGIFILCPQGLKSSIKELRVSNQVQILPYNENSNLSEYKKDIELKIGVILATPQDLGFFAEESLEENIYENKISLLLSPTIISKAILNIAAPKFIASAYSQSNAVSQIFSSLNMALKHHISIAFLWDIDQIGSILNPEAQVLKILDDLFEDQEKQHFRHK